MLSNGVPPYSFAQLMKPDYQLVLKAECGAEIKVGNIDEEIMYISARGENPDKIVGDLKFLVDQLYDALNSLEKAVAEGDFNNV